MKISENKLKNEKVDKSRQRIAGKNMLQMKWIRPILKNRTFLKENLGKKLKNEYGKIEFFEGKSRKKS